MQFAVGIARRNKTLARALLACVPDIHWHINIPEIGRFRVRLRRNRSFLLRSPLTHEWYPLAALKAFVKPSDIVWDVGANLGLYTRWLVSHLDAKHVYAFEPMSENLPELRYNVDLGKIADRVTIVPWALSDVDGEVEFQIDDMQSASGTINAVTGGEASRGRSALGLSPRVEKVTSRTLDGIAREGAVPMPDVIKVDVEGAERLLLDGGETFFTEHAPRIVIETHSLEVSKRCLEFLCRHGYVVAACVPQSWNPNRHMRFNQDDLNRMTDQYDAHFIMASKNPADLPEKLDYAHL